jgi:moderate conductance mechanosensitive channel
MFSFGFLPDPYGRLVWGGAAIVLAIVLGRVLKWFGRRLEQRHPAEERELASIRRRETALVLVATAVPYVTAIIALVVIADFFLPLSAAALGGTAFLTIIIGFAAQRFLMDVVAGTLIVFERWYAVGDFIMVEPAKASGLVEQFSLRTTVLRSFNGDRVYVPNSQIIAAVRSPRGYRSYRIEIITSDAEEAQRAVEAAGRRAPVGEARFLRPPHVIEVRELGEDTWLVRGRADVAPTMEWLAEDFLRTALKSHIRSEALLAEPIIYTLDEGTLSRYERRVLVR